MFKNFILARCKRAGDKMICFVALLVFAILGIFSASHRELAKEAFDCVFRRITLRKCETSFDKKMRMKISTGLLKKSPALGGFVHKNFEILSWAMTIIMMVSLVYGVWGVYNYAAYGNCYGPNSTEYCVYDAVLGTETCGEEACQGEECNLSAFEDCTGDCDCRLGGCATGALV